MSPSLAPSPPAEVIYDRVTTVPPSRVGRPPVFDVSFTVEANEHVALVGRAGSGKKTLLDLAAGLYPPDSGSVLVDGATLALMDYAELQAHRLRTGFVFETNALLVNTSIFENVALPLRYHAGRTLHEGEKRARVQAVLDELGIADFAGETPARVSSSVQKRALFARALLLEPAVLLLDEPQQHLVTKEQELVLAAIEARRASRGLTVLQADHDGRFGALVPERVIVLESGRIARAGSYEALMAAAGALGSDAGAPGSSGSASGRRKAGGG